MRNKINNLNYTYNCKKFPFKENCNYERMKIHRVYKIINELTRLLIIQSFSITAVLLKMKMVDKNIYIIFTCFNNMTRYYTQ